MKCDNPYNIKLTEEKSAKHGINNAPVKCGRCLPCKKNRIAQWSIRLEKEMEISTSAMFVTLTYDNLHIPITTGRYPMTLLKNSKQDAELQQQEKEDRSDRSIQAFFKRLRYYEGESKKLWNIKQKEIEEQKPLKYYACGEYGSQKFRPHYHIILFNLVDYKNLNRAWATAVVKNGTTVDHIPFGEVDIQDVNPNTIKYVLKYINKDNWNRFHKDDNRVKEFSLMSKGLGKNWITPKVESFYNRRLDINYTISSDGYKVAMPRYYRDKMLTEETKDDAIMIIKKNIEENQRKIEEKAKITGENLELTERSRKFVHQKIIEQFPKRKN